MKRLSEVLDGAIGRPEVVRQARAHQVMRRWREAVGDLLADNSTPDRYDHGTLWVAASGSAWCQEVRMHKDLIVSRLNEMAGDGTLFTTLRVGVRPARRDFTLEPGQCEDGSDES